MAVHCSYLALIEDDPDIVQWLVNQDVAKTSLDLRLVVIQAICAFGSAEQKKGVMDYFEKSLQGLAEEETPSMHHSLANCCTRFALLMTGMPDILTKLSAHHQLSRVQLYPKNPNELSSFVFHCRHFQRISKSFDVCRNSCESVEQLEKVVMDLYKEFFSSYAELLLK